MGKPSFPAERRRRLWCAIRAGDNLEEAAAAAGGSLKWARYVVRQCGGVNPEPIAEPEGRYLSFDEREEIMRLRAAGRGVRAIGREIGRDPSTISRELKRGSGTRGYKASVAQAWRRPGPSGAAGGEAGHQPAAAARGAGPAAERHDSPEQIAGRLKVDFPDEPEMWVSPETIYQSLYIQSRGGLKRELTAHLRTGRYDAQAAPSRG